MPIEHPAILGRHLKTYKVDPRQIEVDPTWNSRTDYGDLEELSADIETNGLLVPLDIKKVGNRLVLVNGERRLRAIKMAINRGAEFPFVKCEIAKPGISDVEAMLLQLGTNRGKPFEPLEEAEGYRRLEAWGLPVAQIAKRSGKSVQHVRGRLQLVQAGPDVRQAIKDKAVPLKAAVGIVRASEGDLKKQAAEVRAAVSRPKAKRKKPAPALKTCPHCGGAL
jgi:ParB-like chromosome segregation protein Spo0J